MDGGSADGGIDASTAIDSGAADSGATDRGIRESGASYADDAGSDAVDAIVEAGADRVDLPRDPVPVSSTVLRLVNDSEAAVYLLEGCNGESWLTVEELRDPVPNEACECRNKLTDGTCLTPEPTGTCQLDRWWSGLAAGATTELSLRLRRLTWFDDVGCYLWEGVPDGVPLDYHVALANELGETVAEITRTIATGTALIEIKVSEAVSVDAGR